MTILKKSLIAAALVLPAVWVLAYELWTPVEVPTYTVQNGSGSTITGTLALDVSSKSNVLAYVSNVHGSAEIRNSSGMLPVAKDTSLRMGDNLTTKAWADVEIIFADSSVIRISENSSFSISASSDSETELTLANGTLWARILKPLGDSSFFTVKTSDLSAGVRGTAILVKTKWKGSSSVSVIDSFNAGHPSVTVKYQDKNEEKEITLSAEEGIAVDDGGAKKEKADMDKLLSDTFVRSNTKLDILYMRNLEKSVTDNPNLPKKEALLAKLDGEMKETLPKPKEMKAFFDSNGIRTYMETVYNGGSSSSNLSDSEKTQVLINAIRDDSALLEKKNALERLRKETVDGDETKKAEFQKEANALEEQIQSFDVEWQNKLKSQENTGSGVIQEPEGQQPAPTPVPAPISPKPAPIVAPKPTTTTTPAPKPTTSTVPTTTEPKPTTPTTTTTTTPAPKPTTTTTVSGPAVIR